MSSDTYALSLETCASPEVVLEAGGPPFCVQIAYSFAQKIEHHPCAPFSGTALSLCPWGLGPEAQLFSLKR